MHHEFEISLGRQRFSEVSAIFVQNCRLITFIVKKKKRKEIFGRNEIFLKLVIISLKTRKMQKLKSCISSGGKILFFPFCYYFAITNGNMEILFLFRKLCPQRKENERCREEEEEEEKINISWISYFITLLSLSKMSLLIFLGEILGDSM